MDVPLKREAFLWGKKKGKKGAMFETQEATISSSWFIQKISRIQRTCARRATLSQDRMKSGAKRYLPSLWYPSAPPPHLRLSSPSFLSSFKFTNFLLHCPDISSPHLSISSLCGYQLCSYGCLMSPICVQDKTIWTITQLETWAQRWGISFLYHL